MWPRVVEVMLGCWLLASPFIFRLGPEETFFWVNDLAVGAVVVAVALVACAPRAGKLRLLQLVVSLYLLVIAFTGPAETAAGPMQNFLVLAWLLLLTAILPTRSTLPPRAWQAFYERRPREPLSPTRERR